MGHSCTVREADWLEEEFSPVDKRFVSLWAMTALLLVLSRRRLKLTNRLFHSDNATTADNVQTLHAVYPCDAALQFSSRSAAQATEIIFVVNCRMEQQSLNVLKVSRSGELNTQDFLANQARRLRLRIRPSFLHSYLRKSQLEMFAEEANKISFRWEKRNIHPWFESSLPWLCHRSVPRLSQEETYVPVQCSGINDVDLNDLNLKANLLLNDKGCSVSFTKPFTCHLSFSSQHSLITWPDSGNLSVLLTNKKYSSQNCISFD